ncbi:hypothetical protein FM104_02970 [Microbacterium esteraromaticum]|uniref:Uncharacterized protein n=1 Tax=Microbacterium esteraromaticum TaxID=57043 RepID=A0A1R4IN76_9MICO|nr:hypothetical protein [Microbacterium esteraromaticum]SJN21085.1 hypothetical protein FM104_02970 [Microbacterium esteraromaticum]
MRAQGYRETRTKAEIDRLLHYDFVIPISRGFTTKHVNENYPGWTWNQLVCTLNNAGVRVARPGSPSACHDEVVRVHFDSEQSWLVERADGSTTTGPAPAGTTSPKPPSGSATGIHDLSTGMMVEIERD